MKPTSVTIVVPEQIVHNNIEYRLINISEKILGNSYPGVFYIDTNQPLNLQESPTGAISHTVSNIRYNDNGEFVGDIIINDTEEGYCLSKYITDGRLQNLSFNAKVMFIIPRDSEDIDKYNILSIDAYIRKDQ